MRTSKRQIRTALATLVLCGLLAGPALAGQGLRTKFAEVSVENLKIGQTVSMAEVINFPLRVMNTGKDPVDLVVDVIKGSGAEIKAGFESIPDTSWIKLQQSTFTVPPGLEAVTDVIITIPNDPSLLGRRFVVYLWTQSLGSAEIGVALKSRLLLTISSALPTDEELKKKFVRKRLANLNFSLSPMELLLGDAETGKKLELKDKNAVKILNPNAEPYDFRLASVPVWETTISPPPGFEATPDPKWLEIGKSVVKVKPDSISALKLSLNMPKGQNLEGKRYMFLLRAEILQQDIPAYAYVKIFVETKK